MMELQVGMVLEGRVVSIAKFGAFVELEPGRSGLVHISEVSYTFVNDIHDVLTEGQTVKVKVIGIDPNGRISLSIKKTLPPPARPAAPRRTAPSAAGSASGSREGGAPSRPASQPRSFHPAPPAPPTEPVDFEDRLKRFMKSSDAKMSDLNRHNDKRGGGSRRGSRGSRGG